MALNWMLFQPEGSDVLYLWNGEFACLSHVAPHEGEDHSSWYWAGSPPEELDEAEKQHLNEIAAAKRKQIFTVPRKGKRRFIVVSRGTFHYQNS